MSDAIRTPRRAPGKAMLFGEYAVLEGAPALVAAVDRYVTVTPLGDGEPVPDSPYVHEAYRALAERHGKAGSLPGLRVDSSPLYADGAGGRKLGLGSSAAVTAAVFGPHEAMTNGEIWLACEAAHTRAQGARGSGADLAAAIWGGVIRFRPAPGGRAPEVAPVTLAPDLDVTLVDTGAPASTPDRLTRLAAIRARDPAAHDALFRPLVELSLLVAAEAEARGVIPFRAVDDWNRALDALAAAIDMEIVTDAHRAVADAARAAGGAGKPSGAGGGDLAVCFTPSNSRGRLVQELGRRGFSPLAVRIGARGLHPVPSEPK